MFILALVWIYYIDHMFISTFITLLQALSNRLSIRTSLGFPGGPSSKESAYRCRRHKRCGFDSCVGKIPWRRKWQPTPVSLGFPCGSAGKESACNVGDLGSIPRLGRSPGEGKGYPLQYSGLENSMDCIVHGGRRELDTTERLSLSCWFTSLYTETNTALYSNYTPIKKRKDERVT